MVGNSEIINPKKYKLKTNFAFMCFRNIFSNIFILNTSINTKIDQMLIFESPTPIAINIENGNFLFNTSIIAK